MSFLFNCICGSDTARKGNTEGKNEQGELKLTPVGQDLLKFSPNIFTSKIEFESPFRPKKLADKNSAVEIMKLTEFDISKLGLDSSKMSTTKQRLSNLGVNISKSPNKDSSKSKPPSHWQKKGRILCFFCGGESCRHENYLKNPNINNAIIGLHSDYITHDIIASQRPSTVLMNKYNLVKIFKEMNIGLIVNVQREGEHPYCGSNKKLEDSGFTYNPSQFQVEDIKVKLSGWKDMSVPDSVMFMLDIVKEMSVTIKEARKKALVHCHAGYGRTGVVIACYMLYTTSESVELVVGKIREKRKECIQKKDQYAFCETFSEYINKARNLFDLYNIYDDKPQKKPLEIFINNQRDMLYGIEAKLLEHIPIVIYRTLEKLLETKKIYKISNILFYTSLLESKKWSAEYENALNSIKQAINIGDYSLLNQTENIVVISQLLYDWLEDDIEYVIDPNKITKLLENDKFSQSLELILQKSNIDSKSILREEDVIFYLLNEIKRNLSRLVEMETLIKTSQFFYLIYPLAKEENENYIHCVDKLSLHLMGYKYFEINSKKDSSKLEKIKNQVTTLSNVIQFFVLGMRSELWENNFFLFANKIFTQEDGIRNTTPYSKPILPHKNTIKHSPNTHAVKENNLISNMVMNKTPQTGVVGDVPEFNNYSESDNKSLSVNTVSNISQGDQEEIFYKVLTKLSNYFDRKDEKIVKSKKNLMSQISNIVSMNDIGKSNEISKTPKIENEKHLRDVIREFSAEPKKSMIKNEPWKKIEKYSKKFKTLTTKEDENSNNLKQIVQDSRKNPNENNFRPYAPSGSSDIDQFDKSDSSVKAFKSDNQFNGIEIKKNSEKDVNKIVKNLSNNRYNKFSHGNGSKDLKFERNLISVPGEKLEFDFNPNKVESKLNYKIEKIDFDLNK